MKKLNSHIRYYKGIDNHNSAVFFSFTPNSFQLLDNRSISGYQLWYSGCRKDAKSSRLFWYPGCTLCQPATQKRERTPSLIKLSTLNKQIIIKNS